VPLILLDKNIPWGVRPHLVGHTVRTTEDEGWSTLTNGDLLNAAEQADFDVMLTADTRIRYQQNLGGRRLALVVLTSPAWPPPGHPGRRRYRDAWIVSGSPARATGEAGSSGAIAISGMAGEPGPISQQARQLFRDNQRPGP
jgi:hypothetical protein